MRILIDIGHPAHVHLFKNLYYELLKKGHKIWVTVRDIHVAMELLERYKIPHTIIGQKSDGIIHKGIEQFKFDKALYSLLKKYNIDIAIGSPFNIAHASKFSKASSILLDDDDDEVQPLMVKFGHPFADTVLSPVAVLKHRKVRSSIFYSGYHELAYLHPNRFTPDSAILSELGVQKCEPFFVMRFNVFKAHHDIGERGLNLENKLRLVLLLEEKGKIFITTEREIEPELAPFQLQITPEKMHSLLYYATMFIGDSQTMSSEAAVLGTPAIRCNSFVGRISYLEEEEHKYGLTYGFKPDETNLMPAKIEELLNMPDLKQEWQYRRQKMLADKIDVTAFLVWFVENYPESVSIMKENPGYQERFK